MLNQNNTFKKILLICIPMWMSFAVVGQEKAAHTTHETHDAKGQHRFTFELSHTHISEGRGVDGDRKWLALPSVGIKYDYWLSNKWAAGFHTDIITETFIVEEHLGSGVELERSKPLSLLAMALFKPTSHSTFLFGMGGEFAKEKNLIVNRVGYEWGAHVLPQWEVGGSLCYDFRWNAYDSWSVGIGVSYLLSNHKRTTTGHHGGKE